MNQTSKIVIEPKLTYIEGKFCKDKALVIDKGIIAKIGDKAQISQRYPDVQRDIRWENLIAIPGCVNVHNHSFQSLLRGLVCDKPFLEWRDKALYRYSPHFSPQDVYVGALLSFAEMLKYGTTAVCDFFYLHGGGNDFDEMVIKAAHDLGIRLTLSRTMYDSTCAPACYRESPRQAASRAEELFYKYKDDEFVSIALSPHSVHGASEEMISEGVKLARRLGCPLQLHVSEEKFEVNDCIREHGLTPVRFLDRLGAINEDTLLVHAIYIDEGEKEIIARRGAKLAHCPSSNMFLADGAADIPTLTAKGVTVGLGTDGACANSRNNIFEEMRMAALFQKGVRRNAECINYRQVFAMGTSGGAQILRLKSGEISVGFNADLVGISFNELSMQPAFADSEAMLANIVYAMQPCCVREVMCGGVEVVSGGRCVFVDEERIAKLVKETMRKVTREELL